MDVSVIIVNYNSVNVIIDCIDSIISRTSGLNYEVIVVDNASPDKSADMIENHFGDKVKLIRSDKNLGFGKANNLGAGYAEGKYLFMLNPDTVLINNAIKVLFDFMEAHPDAGIAGGNLYGADQVSAAPSFCREFDSIKSEQKNSTWRRIITDKVKQKLSITGRPYKKEFNYSEDNIEVAYIFGADMMMPGSLFKEMGGFDPDFFMYAEEAELQWRINKAGYKVYNVPSAKIVHLEGMSIKQQNEFSEKQFRMRMESLFRFFEKCYGYGSAEQLYRCRSRKYKRSIAVNSLHNKKNTGTTTKKILRCLNEVFASYNNRQ